MSKRRRRKKTITLHKSKGGVYKVKRHRRRRLHGLGGVGDIGEFLGLPNTGNMGRLAGAILAVRFMTSLFQGVVKNVLEKFSKGIKPETMMKLVKYLTLYLIYRFGGQIKALPQIKEVVLFYAVTELLNEMNILKLDGLGSEEYVNGEVGDDGVGQIEYINGEIGNVVRLPDPVLNQPFVVSV